MARHEPGDIFEVTVDRFTGSGNAIVELGYGHLNIGRVNCEIGDSFEVEFIEMTIAYCRDAEKRGDDYNISKEYGMADEQNSDDSIDYTNSTELENKNNLLNNLR